MNREQNALPPPPPHPARLAKSPSYYLPPRISNPNQSPQFPTSSHSQINNGSQQIPLRQPAYQHYQYPNVINNAPHVYAPQQNVPPAHSPGSQPRSPSTHSYQGIPPQSYTPQPPILQQTNVFPYQTVLPPASNIKNSFFSSPAARKARPESMPPLPSSSLPKPGPPSFLMAPTMVNHIPSISALPNSPVRNITPATGAARRPLPTPSPTKTLPMNVAGSTALSYTGSSFKQNTLPPTKNQPVFPTRNSQSPSPSHSRALPSSPVSPPDLSKLRLGNDNDTNSGIKSQVERRSDVASIKAKFEDNSESTYIPMHTNSPSRFLIESPELQEESVTAIDRHLVPRKGNMINGIFQSEFSNSRSPSPTSPLYGILDLPSRSRSDSRSGGEVSPSQQSESVVYAPSPVRAERALQSSGMGSEVPDLDRTNKSTTSGQTNQRQSNIYKLASLSLEDEVKQALHLENFDSGPYAKSDYNIAPRNAPYINEHAVDRTSDTGKASSYDVPPVPVIHAPPTHTGSTSNRPVITLTSKVQVNLDESNLFEHSRKTQTVIPSISVPEADADLEDDHGYGSRGPTISVADYSAHSQTSNDRPISNSPLHSTTPSSPSKFRGSSPNGMKRSLPPPPPSPQRQSTTASTYDPRSRPRGDGLVCGGCGKAIVGRIVSAMSRRWHPQCFKCADCGELLEHVSAYEHDGHPYCHLDYHERFAPRCYHCKTPVVEERFITLDDPALGKRAYHEQHFFCAECGDPFLTPSITRVRKPGEISVSGDGEFDLDEDDVGFTVYKGHPYCEACHVRLRMPKCKMCKKSIRPGMHALEALGGKWCWECFVCAACEKPFQNPSFFQRDQKPYCEPCFSLMLRNEI